MSPEKKAKKPSGRMERSVTLRATPEEVWKAVSEAEGIARWFAPEVSVKPGPGGELFLAWDGQGFPTPITIWEPGRRLVCRDPDAADGVHLATEYVLEAKGGTTVLRVVQSGFEEGSDMEQGLDRGWAVFLSNLRHALERAKGLPCAYGYAQIQPAAAEGAFARLLGPGLLGLEGDPGALEAGARVTLAPGGERCQVEVDLWKPGLAFGAARLGRNERFALVLEPWGFATAYRLAYGLAPGEVAGHLARWKALAAAAGPAASGA
ncbi:MAG: SRPBCC domain-containing protein [Anaeromyxobacteraceae bacterium]